MSHLPTVGCRQWNVWTYIVFLFFMLSLLGATMVVPFLITISGSTCNALDYQRFQVIPRYFWSTEDRYMKGLVGYFNTFKDWNLQLKVHFKSAPEHWSSWIKIGEDTETSDQLAREYLDAAQADLPTWKVIAADYSDFCDTYDLKEMQTAVESTKTTEFLKDRYSRLLRQVDAQAMDDMSGGELRRAALDLLGEKWGMPFESFYDISFNKTEMRYPVAFQRFFWPDTPKFNDFLNIKHAYRSHMFTPGIESRWSEFLQQKGKSAEGLFPVNEDTDPEVLALWKEFKRDVAPAAPAVPIALRAAWYKFLSGSERVLKLAKMPLTAMFDIQAYNRLAGTNYERLRDTPFPVPASFNPEIQKVWDAFVLDYYPLRLTKINVTPELEAKYHAFLEKTVKFIRVANETLETTYSEWNQFKLSPTAPTDKSLNLWSNFVRKLPVAERHVTSSEQEYQSFLLKKYNNLAAVNKAYGWDLKHIEEAFPPLDIAYTVTFMQNETAFAVEPVLANYKVIFDYLVLNGRAIPVTIILVSLAVLSTLTINPMAAYALSRFNLPGQSKIILFMLATMAFPYMVSAIPAYLLMRDLGLLNTFFALVLPSAANGMAIFILKGFFDSLPQELFEAATIDGASELQIFRIVAMPLVKPILAIKCVQAFLMAYNGWMWALIICQDKDMWTLAVWMFQASTWWGQTPWIVSAGFVVTSIPTMLVFLSCQKIILRGIVIPSMK